ncbi:hypothetical protein Scep_000846 [Stephania cephalantha]|uniref:Pectin acetylesterase n=1 Tax=Stephania cephalantha TaxID=152367 RepID=A0AAP0Q3A0_9MAGN
MEELMAQGMHSADQALLSGCSAGGLASILHCDEFRELFPATTKSVALSVGDWFFDRVGVSAIDCPYPCDNTCHNLVFK